MTSESDRQVSVVDAVGNCVLKQLKVGVRPRAVAFTPDGAQAFVTGEGDATSTVIDARKLSVVDTIRIDDPAARAMDALVSPDGCSLYVSTGREGAVVEVDTQSRRVVRSVKVGARPWGLALSPDGKRVYVANGPSDDISVIDTRSFTVIATVAAGKGPWGIAVSTPKRSKTNERAKSLPFSVRLPIDPAGPHSAGSGGFERCNVSVVTEPLDIWFKREILSHEEILVRFIARVWPRRHEIADIRQEAYARVYEAARQARPQAPKSFLFATARHLMADRIRRERIVSIRAGGENEYLNVLVDEISPEQRVGAHQELARLARAFDRLSSKCREVVWLRRVKELSQKEVAERLGLAEKTVEKRLRTGARQLANYMRENALTPRTSRNEIDGDNDEARHEQGPHERH